MGWAEIFPWYKQPAAWLLIGNPCWKWSGVAPGDDKTAQSQVAHDLGLLGQNIHREHAGEGQVSD